MEKAIESTLNGTLQRIDLKAVRRRILDMTPPTDILHRVTLIISAMVLLYCTTMSS
jgi:hypothetical protein